MAVSAAFAGIILMCAILFGLYDYLMRREARERKNVVDHLVRENKRQANEVVWEIKKGDLIFEEPSKILGRGSFGLVLLAQYRGTSVAVKRVIPPREGTDGSHSAFDAMTSMFISQDAEIGLISRKSWGASLGSLTNLSKSSPLPSSEASPSYEELKQEFLEEMRYLSRLRHPCVTTVMGAVVDEDEDPMLVMEYMDHGSLYDILHNETLAIDGEILLPILRDISQGMRFLHASDPRVIHGDLKAQNVLVDSRFRAKVADFGLSQKQKVGGTGTPYWMAPELLRMESPNTMASDVFSFGGTSAVDSRIQRIHK